MSQDGVQAAIKVSQEATLASVTQMLADNNTLLLGQLGPMFQAAVAESMGQQAGTGAAASRESEESKSLAAEVAAEERARVQEALPDRVLQPDIEARQRGGQARYASRMEIIDRLRQNTGDVTAKEMAEIGSILQLGHQVSSLPPPSSSERLSLCGVGVEASAERSASSLFAKMQEQGLAAPSPGEEALRAVQKVFKLAGEKESKKVTALTSYMEFVEFMRKAKVLTREAHEKDPESYWQMQWHDQSMKHVYTQWGWATALCYHTQVMKAWQEGFMDLPSMVDTEECRRGDVAGALHQRYFMVALQTTGAKPRSTKAQGDKPATGIWCTFCNKSAGHLVGVCRMKKKHDEAVAQGKKP
jgi:hypothetical protein